MRRRWWNSRTAGRVIFVHEPELALQIFKNRAFQGLLFRCMAESVGGVKTKN
jgi:hypothetical protein